MLLGLGFFLGIGSLDMLSLHGTIGFMNYTLNCFHFLFVIKLG